MNPATVAAVLDAGMVMMERLAKFRKEARKEGLITAEEQQKQLDRIDELNKKYGVD